MINGMCGPDATISKSEEADVREPSNTTNVRNLEDQMVAAIQQAISKNPPADDSEVDRYDRGLFELSRALRGISGIRGDTPVRADGS